MSTPDHTPVKLPKRRRTAIACTSCRTRKSRCDGAWPSCSLCLEIGEACHYVGPSNRITARTGVPAASRDSLQASSGGGSGSSLIPASLHDEARLRAIESKLDRLLAAASISDPQLPSPLSLDKSSPDEAAVVVIGTDGQGNAANGQEGEEEDEEGAMDGMASVAEPSNTRDKAFYGPTSSIAFLKHLCSASLSLFDTTTQPSARASAYVPPVKSIFASDVEGGGSSSNPLALPPDAEVRHLLQTYFDKSSPMSPYLYQEHVYSAYERGRAKGFRRPFLALLNTIFAFTIFEDRNGSTDGLSCKRHLLMRSETYFARALALVQNTDTLQVPHNIETVQCYLLMTQYSQGTVNSARVLFLFSQAVTAAMQSGLHCPSHSPPSSPVESEIRRRTWWMCICLDKLVSMTHGRPPMIPPAYILVDQPSSARLSRLSSTRDTGSDEPGDDKAFVLTIQQCQILGQLISDVYSNNLTNVTQSSLSESLQKTLSIESQIRSWHQSLPHRFRYQHPDQPLDPNLQPTRDGFLALTLHLRYLNIRILNYRSILSSHLLYSDDIDPIQQPILAMNGGQDDASFLKFFARQGLSAIEESASELITILKAYGARHSVVGERWFASYYVFHACLSLYGVFLVLASAHARQTGQQQHPGHQSMFNQDTEAMVRIASTLRGGKETLAEISKGTAPRTRDQQQALLANMVEMATTWGRRQQSLAMTTTTATTTTDDGPVGDVRQQVGGVMDGDDLGFGVGASGSPFHAYLDDFLHGSMDAFYQLEQGGDLF